MRPPSAADAIKEKAVPEVEDNSSADVAIEKEAHIPVIDAVLEPVETNSATAVPNVEDTVFPPRVKSAKPQPKTTFKLPQQPKAPASIPNTQNIKELATRRRIATSSTKTALGSLTITPSRPCNFAPIKLGTKSVKEFWVGNSGNDSTRIKVKAEGKGISVEWGVGPIAPGMRRKVVVRAEGAEVGKLEGVVRVIGEMEVLEIKVVGEVTK